MRKFIQGNFTSILMCAVLIAILVQVITSIIHGYHYTYVIEVKK